MEFSEVYTPVDSEFIYARGSNKCDKTGPTLVFIHGLIVSGSYMLPTATLLAEDYAVLVPDLPGYGNSSMPEQCMNIRQLASVMSRWFDLLDIKTATLVANSFGCHVAAEMALLNPHRINGLILIGPPDCTEKRVHVQVSRLLHCALLEHPSLIPLVAKDLYQIKLERAFQSYEYMLQHNLDETLNRAGVRTLLMHGENDPLAPAEFMQATAKTIASAKLRTVPHAGHSTNYSQADDTAALIREFLDENNSNESTYEQAA